MVNVCERRARSEDNWCQHKEALEPCPTNYEQPIDSFEPQLEDFLDAEEYADYQQSMGNYDPREE